MLPSLHLGLAVWVTVATAGLFLGSALPAVEIVGHRGASADAPENTLAAMRMAWEQGADAIELDLWLSKDGRIVVMHDRNTKRVGGPDCAIADQTWDELRQLDVGKWKGIRFKGERMPTLESVLATIPAGKRAFLEIKCGPEVLPELSRVLHACGKSSSQVAIICFDKETLRQSKRRFPNHEHYYLIGYSKDRNTGRLPDLAGALEEARSGGFDGLDLHCDWPIDAAFVAQVRAAKLKLAVWTVNSRALARRLAEAGVDAITTDRPAWLRKGLK